MQENIIFWLITLSLLLHSSWELLQVRWVENLQEKPWHIVVRNSVVGISLDTLYIFTLFTLWLL